MANAQIYVGQAQNQLTSALTELQRQYDGARADADRRKRELQGNLQALEQQRQAADATAAGAESDGARAAAQQTHNDLQASIDHVKQAMTDVDKQLSEFLQRKDTLVGQLRNLQQGLDRAQTDPGFTENLF